MRALAGVYVLVALLGRCACTRVGTRTQRTFLQTKPKISTWRPTGEAPLPSSPATASHHRIQAEVTPHGCAHRRDALAEDDLEGGLNEISAVTMSTDQSGGVSDDYAADEPSVAFTLTEASNCSVTADGGVSGGVARATATRAATARRRRS